MSEVCWACGGKPFGSKYCSVCNQPPRPETVEVPARNLVKAWCEKHAECLRVIAKAEQLPYNETWKAQIESEIWLDCATALDKALSARPTTAETGAEPPSAASTHTIRAFQNEIATLRSQVTELTKKLREAQYEFTATIAAQAKRIAELEAEEPTPEMCMAHTARPWDEWTAFDLYVAMRRAALSATEAKEG